MVGREFDHTSGRFFGRLSGDSPQFHVHKTNRMASDFVGGYLFIFTLLFAVD